MGWGGSDGGGGGSVSSLAEADNGTTSPERDINSALAPGEEEPSIYCKERRGGERTECVLVSLPGEKGTHDFRLVVGRVLVVAGHHAVAAAGAPARGVPCARQRERERNVTGRFRNAHGHPKAHSRNRALATALSATLPCPSPAPE